MEGPRSFYNVSEFNHLSTSDWATPVTLSGTTDQIGLSWVAPRTGQLTSFEVYLAAGTTYPMTAEVRFYSVNPSNGLPDTVITSGTLDIQGTGMLNILPSAVTVQRGTPYLFLFTLPTSAHALVISSINSNAWSRPGFMTWTQNYQVTWNGTTVTVAAIHYALYHIYWIDGKVGGHYTDGSADTSDVYYGNAYDFPEPITVLGFLAQFGYYSQNFFLGTVQVRLYDLPANSCFPVDFSNPIEAIDIPCGVPAQRTSYDTIIRVRLSQQRRLKRFAILYRKVGGTAIGRPVRSGGGYYLDRALYANSIGGIGYNPFYRTWFQATSYAEECLPQVVYPIIAPFDLGTGGSGGVIPAMFRI